MLLDCTDEREQFFLVNGWGEELCSLTELFVHFVVVVHLESFLFD
jgi:hypothetical protein